MTPFFSDSDFKEGIDAVITWVDMKDPLWIEMYQDEFNETIDTFRFRDNNEMLYALRSLELYAPFIRNVYIVTNTRVPAWLNTSHPKIQIVQHLEIFENKSCLPVFNSHSIEVNIHRIPSLSRHFIYLNDDFLFTKSVRI